MNGLIQKPTAFGGAKIEKIGEENGIILPLQSRYIPQEFLLGIDWRQRHFVVACSHFHSPFPAYP